jgi:nucleoid-associated protein YgaU
MSNCHRLISKFIAQLCEKQYAFANTTLATIVEAKLKEKIKKEAKKLSGEKTPAKGKSKQSKKEEFLARMAKGKKNSKKASTKNK